MLTKFRHVHLNQSKSLQAPLLVHEGKAVPAGHNSYPCKDVQNSQIGYNLKESVLFQWPSLQEAGSDTGMKRLPSSDEAFLCLHVCYFCAHLCSQWQKWEQSCTKPGSDARRRDVVGEQLSSRDEQLLASWIRLLNITLSAQNRHPCPPHTLMAAQSFIHTPLLNDSWNIHRTIWKHSCEMFKLYTKTQMWARRAAHKDICSSSCSCPEAKFSSLKVHTEHSPSYLKTIWGISHFRLRGFWQYFANIKRALIHFCLSASHV